MKKLDPHAIPKISLIIPAWNEAALLPRLLDTIDLAKENFLQKENSVEVIVADNQSTDSTSTIAHERGCKIVQVHHRCIAATRNGGAAAAQGEILAFADADLRIAPNTFNFIAQAMQYPEIIGGATGLTMERWSLGIRFTWYLVMSPLWFLGFDGGVWFCRRSDFLALGGFNEKIKAGEDVLFLQALKKLGNQSRPKAKLISRWNAASWNLPSAIAINSTRKFDRYGDWHFLKNIFTKFPFIFISKKYFHQFVEDYWYRRPPE